MSHKLISNKPNYTKTERQGKAEVVSSCDPQYPRNTSVTAYHQKSAETPTHGKIYVIHSKTVTLYFILNENKLLFSKEKLVSAVL